MDLILRNARAVGAEHTLSISASPAARSPRWRQARRRRRNARPRRPAGVAGLCRNPHPPRQVVHPRSRQIGQGRRGRGDRGDRKGQGLFHVRRRSRPRIRTLEKSILQGTTHMRTHLEVDPGVGLRGLDGVMPLLKEYAWAIDLQICVFPQEGLTNNPGTEELIVRSARSRLSCGRWRALRRHAIRAARSTASSNWRATTTSISTSISISARLRKTCRSITSAGAPRNSSMAAGLRSGM